MTGDAASNPTLTDQELAAAHKARHDLGPGYPQIALPAWIVEAVDSDSVRIGALSVPPAWDPSRSIETDRDLVLATRRLLRLPDAGVSVATTFSGSVALDRTMTAISRVARVRGCVGVSVITTTPSIDIMRLFLSERSEVVSHFVPCRTDADDEFALDVSRLLETLSDVTSRHPDHLRVVLLTSPENPTGATWSKSELSQIAEACNRSGSVLVVDHCFLLVGVHSDPPTAVWDVAHAGQEWVGIWDTGKTLGLNEEKLGFLISGGELMPSALLNSVNTVQFGVSRRQKLFFSRILCDARFPRYLDDLRELCRANSETLRCAFEGAKSIKIRTPKSGSFAMIDCLGFQEDDEAIRAKLLGADVGVIAGNVFFHAPPIPRNLIRIALARDRVHFKHSVERLRGVLLAF